MAEQWLFRQGELILGPVGSDKIVEKISSHELDGKTEVQPSLHVAVQVPAQAHAGAGQGPAAALPTATLGNRTVCAWAAASVDSMSAANPPSGSINRVASTLA